MSEIKTSVASKVKAFASKGLIRLATEIDEMPINELVTNKMNDLLDEIPVEWRSTPELKYILETDGLGNFRKPGDTENILLPTRAPYAVALSVNIEKGVQKTVSLQKFVALIYHPVLNNEASTVVLDGNRLNLRADNIAWRSNSVGRIY